MRATLRWLRAFPLTAILATVAPAGAQQLTVDAIVNSAGLRARTVRVQWAPDGRSFTRVESTERGTDLIAEEVGSGVRTRIIDGAALVTADGARPLRIEDHAWSPDRSRLLIFANSQRVWRSNTRGTYFLYDIASRRLRPLSAQPGLQMFAKFSPDGRRVGFVRDNDLFVVDVETGRENQLTHDGSATIVNGTTDWVYEEELDLRDAWRWSPDSRRIAFWRFDQSPVPLFPLVDPLTTYPTVAALRYPKVGAANSRVKIGVVETTGGATTWMDTGADTLYLARMDFVTPDEVVIQRLPRLQNRIDVLAGDVATGRTHPLFSDSARTWVEVDDDLTWIRGGRQLLWTSERDGWQHIYLYDRSGALVRQLTTGAYDVTGIAGVDERNGWVYFTAARPTPLERQLYRVRLNGTALQRVTPEPGWHDVDLAPGGSVFLDGYSRNGVPPVYRLRSGADRTIRVLEDNADIAANLRNAGVHPAEFFSFTTADGVRLNGWLLKPPGFDPTRKYPVLMHVYGGPGSQTVADAWQAPTYSPARFLFHNLMARKGYLVASVDGRGTGGRGRAFLDPVFRDLGRWESHDQIEAARYLGTLPFVDASRIGLWGWSYGGYLTALTLESGGTIFKAGVSVAPVTDWRLYDNVYTERYMGTPQLNPDGYRRSSTLEGAAKLESAFLLVHGTADDNVHFQNSEQLASRLIEANRQFDFMLYPGQTHSLSFGNATRHVFTLLAGWLEENL